MYKITRHAYQRARQRLGLNKKAFRRALENNKLPEECHLVIVGRAIVTVKNLLANASHGKARLSKSKRYNVLKGSL